jgi:hypothetical protein
MIVLAASINARGSNIDANVIVQDKEIPACLHLRELVGLVMSEEKSAFCSISSRSIPYFVAKGLD